MKYSIIIPNRNRKEFLEYAIASVLSQAGDRTDYELLVSDNYSSDGSYEYIQTITHPCVKILRPPSIKTMSTHFEYLLDQAQGDWITIVGSDDGVQPYFFSLADRLIELANTQNIRVINGERAYYFWQDCGKKYGNIQTQYIAESRYIIKSADKEFMPTLLRGEGFFSMPQIYAGSLVHKDVIAYIKRAQNGIFFKSIAGDGYASAAMASIGERYIHSYVPLTWIGTSPEKQKVAEFYDLPKDTIECAKELGGDYANLKHIGITMWMWECMLNASMLQSQKTQRFYRTKSVAYIICVTIVRERHKYTKYMTTDEKIIGERNFKNLMQRLDVNPAIVYTMAFILHFYKQDFFVRAWRKIGRICGFIPQPFKILTNCHNPTKNANILESCKLTQELYDKEFANTKIHLKTKRYWREWIVKSK
ncbi:glycosyltransferase family 2 protein [Helicobacter labetoulli]|uniref:glycosyltransferase family 2 protein n=1 Tax=Helicobacter labetoulli TaxID=2315333 RepID=UPI0013007960|nr:glycosyltransferase family A protein [Helicobacter labetoulli]